MNLDRELIVRAQLGDTIAEEELVRELAPMVFRVASRFFRTREDVEELAQEAFARFFNKIQLIRPADNVRGWVSRVTINVCYDRLRKIRREKAAIEGLSVEPVAPPRPDPDAYEHVRTAVERLDAKLRIPLVLKEVDELSIREISQVMGITESNVKIRLHRARKKLAAVLEAGVN